MARTRDRVTSRRFAAALAAIALLAVALRVTYVVAAAQHDHHLYDAAYYELQAEAIVNGEGFFTDPFHVFHPSEKEEPAADHPPLTVVAFLPGALLKTSHASNLAMRFTTVLFGAITVLLIGLLARNIGGELVGLVAAGVAAVDPNLWMNDGLVMSESLAVLLTVAVMVLSYRVFRLGITSRRVAGLATLTALATLTRAELAVVLVLIVLPTLYVAAGRDRRLRLRSMGGAVAAFVVVLAPWCAFNLSRFDKPVLISTGAGLALRSANCPTTYYGSGIGWSSVFPPCVTPRPATDPSAWDQDNMSEALHYIRGHLTRFPLVVAARLGRIWSVFKIDQAADPVTAEGRPGWAVWLGAVMTWITVPIALFGAVLLRRRGVRIWPLVVPLVGLSLTVVLIAGGLVRYRAPAEPALIVLVSVVLASWIGGTADRATPTT